MTTSGRDTSERATQSRGQPVIEVRDVVRRFGDDPALSGVSLTIQAGEIHALLGPNGAGKTTLIRILTALLHCHEGEVRILGIPLEEIGLRDYRKAFGLVPPGIVPSI